ncbi:MAG: dephospho-CoA kinase [Armatimonadota bacterium]
MMVGLTGGIASGKTLVASDLQELGVPVIDTDDIARQVVAPGQPAWHRLREWLGPDYFCPDGTLDRAAVARRVFDSEADRRRLEAITHPAIFDAVDERVAELEASTNPPDIIAVAVPLLFEVGAEDRFDAVVVVWATPEQQRARLQRDRHYTPEQADARIAAQLPLAEKLTHADYRIDNSGTIDETREQVEALVKRLRAHLECGG